jgi:FMN phosphatase YigB (HAD superfamily)
MKIILDFDDVLFNTKEFRSDLKNIFLKNGVPKKVFERCYYGSAKITKRKLEKYDVIRHIQAIEKEMGIRADNIKKGIDGLIKNCQKYIFNDSIVFLNSFSKKNLFLISYTNTRFQNSKISKSGIKNFFRKIILTEGLKSEGIKKLKKDLELKREAIYFLDDRVEQIEDIKKNYPRVTTIFVKRGEGRYKDKKNKYCDFEAINLKEAYSIIKKANE